MIRLVLLSTILAMAAAVWGVGQLQASADRNGTRAINAGEHMLIAMLDQETGVRGYINTRDRRFLEPYQRGRADLDSAIAEARRYATRPNDRASIDRQVAIARRWQALAETTLARLVPGGKPSIARALPRKQVMDAFRVRNASFLAKKQADRISDRRTAQLISVGVIIALGLLFAVLTWLLFERPARGEARRRRRLAELADALQVARAEEEAFGVMRRYVETLIEHARAVVLIRNASHNRLQAATPLDDTPILASGLEGAAPDSCLAVRLAKTHTRDVGDQGLLVCELCGALPYASTCVPTVVGGEVVGSVLVQAPQPPGRTQQEDLQTSVAAAGPVIANLRNLAIAELRAATDALTGLPNQRSIQDTLNRMVAQASRAKSPLTAIMFDLDHFKQVNDIHGHAKGDEVLAAVAATVQAVIRESDFAGRYGGEEFIVLLPDTAVGGGVMVAEKLRSSVADLDVPDLDRRLSASFGVASMPEHATTGENLVRAADRALYAAKNAGRNRVEVVRSGERRDEPAEAL